MKGEALIYKPMEAAEIRGIMRRRGVSIAQLAKELGEAPEAVTLKLQRVELDEDTACKYMDALQEIKRKGVKMGLTEDTRIDIIQPVAVLREYRNGSTLELNVVEQGGRERWDIRRWHFSEDGTKCPGRGIFFSLAELETLKAVLVEQLGGDCV